ncbi:hypothetical protein PG997_013411 [Apiospora hydei]|uniref:Uncharacterized protein n=1 Tax=Apiospora hydei TaxID=1337664 RepID=A0ABR1V9D2_9PEZI
MYGNFFARKQAFHADSGIDRFPFGTRDVNEHAFASPPEGPAGVRGSRRIARARGRRVNHAQRRNHTRNTSGVSDDEPGDTSGNDTASGGEDDDEVMAEGETTTKISDDADSEFEGIYTRQYLADNNVKTAMEYYNLGRAKEWPDQMENSPIDFLDNLFNHHDNQNTICLKPTVMARVWYLFPNANEEDLKIIAKGVDRFFRYCTSTVDMEFRGRKKDIRNKCPKYSRNPLVLSVRASFRRALNSWIIGRDFEPDLPERGSVAACWLCHQRLEIDPFISGCAITLGIPGILTGGLGINRFGKPHPFGIAAGGTVEDLKKTAVTQDYLTTFGGQLHEHIDTKLEAFGPPVQDAHAVLQRITDLENQIKEFAGKNATLENRVTKYGEVPRSNAIIPNEYDDSSDDSPGPIARPGRLHRSGIASGNDMSIDLTQQEDSPSSDDEVGE